MNSSYSNYLLLMTLVVVGAAAVAAAFLAKARKPAVRPIIVKPVDSGSVSIFFDRFGNATLIPYVQDLFGEGKATDGVTYLSQPCTPTILGAAIRKSLASCKDSKPAGSKQLMERLCSPNWKTFSEGKANLSIYFKKGTGIVFNTTSRTSEGAYIFNTRGMEHSLPADASDEMIGTASLELLKRCRC